MPHGRKSIATSLVLFVLAVASSASGVDGVHAWSKRIGGTSDDQATSVAVDSAGNVIVAGNTLSSAIDFGGGPLPTINLGDFVIAKYSPSGAHVWSRRIGGVGYDTVSSIATDASGNIVVVGETDGATIDLGGGLLNGFGGFDLFVAKYSPGGVFLWGKRFGGTSADLPIAVAFDPSGSVLLAGHSSSPSINLGGNALTGFGTYDIVVAKYASDGTHAWSKRLGGGSSDYSAGIASDSAGNVLLSGHSFSSPLDLGGGPLAALGDYDLLVAKFSPDGTHVWSKRFGGASADYAGGVVSDSSGNVLVTGWAFSVTIDLGGGPLGRIGSYDLIVAKYSQTGAHLWSRRVGGSASDMGRSIAADGAGNVMIVGSSASPTADFGGGPLSGYGGDDILLAKYSASGTHMWSKRFGGTAADQGLAGASGASGVVALVGAVQSASIDFGGGALGGAGSNDMSVALFKEDATAPSSTLDFNPVATSAPLPSRAVTGTSSDDLSGVDSVSVRFTSLVTGTVVDVVATLTCDQDRRSCRFTAPTGTVSPGLYSVRARATDRARNTESPGPAATIIVI